MKNALFNSYNTFKILKNNYKFTISPGDPECPLSPLIPWSP